MHTKKVIALILGKFSLAKNIKFHDFTHLFDPLDLTVRIFSLPFIGKISIWKARKIHTRAQIKVSEIRNFNT